MGDHLGDCFDLRIGAGNVTQHEAGAFARQFNIIGGDADGFSVAQVGRSKEGAEDQAVEDTGCMPREAA
ncbi:hypothetical protein NBRC116594_18710 [Shimia sp. NS0008-38b]